MSSFPVESSPYLDGLLLRALQQDDEEALRHLFTTYYNSLFRAGLRWSADSYLTEECIQGVFQDLWRYRHTLGGVLSFDAYLKGSLKKRLFRQLGRQLPHSREDVSEVVLPAESFEDVLIRQEEDESRVQRLRNALNELSPRQKEIIVLKYFDELSYREIAERTGLQVDSIYKTLHEGIKKLRSFLSVSS